MLPEEATDEGEVTPIEILHLIKSLENRFMNSTCHITYLITTQVHNGKKAKQLIGSTRMYLGDMIHLVIPKVNWKSFKICYKFCLHNLFYAKYH